MGFQLFHRSYARECGIQAGIKLPTPILTRSGYRKNRWEIAVECLNLFNRDDNDIEYFYESRLPGELAGVEDIHLHPAELRTFSEFKI